MSSTSPRPLPASCGNRGAVAGAATHVGTLFRALCRHDRTTAEHSVRVRRYTLWLADELGLKRAARQRLSIAALLHDVGKVCLPAAILKKPGQLNREELNLVRLHPLISEVIVRTLFADVGTLAAVRWHHERPDGRGYPDGLRGEAIPLPARILAVADSFDAMTSHRPYRQAMGWPAALDMLLCGAGSQFDFEAVECFTRILRKHWNRR